MTIRIMQTDGEGRAAIIPVQAVGIRQAPGADSRASSDGWLPPGGYGHRNPWALENRQALDAYAERIDTEGTAAEQLQAYLIAQESSGSD